MAGGYDGEIRIRTLIENGNASSQLLQLEARMQKTAKEAARLKEEMRKMEEQKIPTEEYKNLQGQFDKLVASGKKFSEQRQKTAKEASRLKEEMSQMEQQRIPTEEYKNLQGQFDKLVASGKKFSEQLKNTEKYVPTQVYTEVQAQLDDAQPKLTSLQGKMEKFLAIGGKKDSKAFKGMQYDVEELENTIEHLKSELLDLEETGQDKTISRKWIDIRNQMKGAGREAAFAKAQMKEMETSGTAYVDPKMTTEYQKLSDKLRDVNNQMDILERKEQEVAGKQNKVGSGAKDIEKVGKAAKKSAGLMSTFASRLKGLALSLFIFNWISKGFNVMVEAFKEGIQNMAKYSGDFNAKMSEMKSATATLKASIGTLAAPIVSAVVPAIVTLCNWLTTAFNKINEFVAALTGKSTWTRAKKQQVDYAKSLDDTAGAAKKAAGALASFDELNVINSNDSGGNGGSDASDMYETVPTSDALIGKLQPFLDYLKSLKDEVIRGWDETWNALDIDSQIADIRHSIESIRGSVSDILGSADVQAAADNFMTTLAYSIGQIGASLVSVGATIAQNLFGGIALYLEENSGRIKEFLVSMFDIGADVAALVGEAAEAFAYVFEAFGSEDGQQLTANVLGIFSDAFMGILELCSSLGRDILDIIVRPFVENKEGFRTALEGFLKTAADVFGTIKETVDNTVDKLLEVYDEHIKPLFDSVASGLSDLAGKFLEFWNTNVQPVMDNLAAKFDEVMGEHIQPLLDKFAELIGSIADALKVFWEEILQPLIAWVIDNVLPVLLPIFEGIGTGIMECFGFIADAIGGLITVIQGIIDFVVDVFTGDWDSAWNAVESVITGAMDRIKATINAVLSVIKTIVTTILNTINAKFEVIFSAIKSTVTSVMTTIKNGIANALGTIKDNWTAVWTSVKTTVVNIFNEIWSAIKGVINSILGGIESMVNSVANGINKLIEGFNTVIGLGSEVTELVFGKSIPQIPTFQTVSIPRLANGGITTGSTLANIGEAGREAVLPLENNLSYLEPFANMIANKLEGVQTVRIIPDESGIFKVVREEANNYFRRTGNAAFLY